MGKISRIFNAANIRRTVKYIRKNGVADGFYAALERLQEKRKEEYSYSGLTEAEREKQERVAEELQQELPVTFSILVPAFETKEDYLRALIESVLLQTWKRFELILADASASDRVEQVVKQYEDVRIRYIRLGKNEGISGNSNAGLREVTGDYVGLLDHDDVLTEDALYEMAKALYAENDRGNVPVMLYSDEDKMDGGGKRFYDPHYKTDFNYDLFLSNNYICHFLVVRAEYLKQVGFRSLYDGAQDYDMILQVLRRVKMNEEMEGRMALSANAGRKKAEAMQRAVIHVPKVLYHWRCHVQSTAENPDSKMYAYEAGRKAVNDYCRELGYQVRMRHEKHLGFYRVSYLSGPLDQRNDLGAVGGRLLRKGRVAGGAYDASGRICYEGMPKRFSGYMHRAVLMQNVDALDIRFLRIREEAVPILMEVFYQETGKHLSERQLGFLQTQLEPDRQNLFIRDLQGMGCTQEQLKAVSLRLGERLRESRLSVAV